MSAEGNTEKLLEARMQNAAAAGLRTYVLLDGAQAEGSQMQLDEWGLPYESLFASTNEENLIEIAPLLIPLLPFSDERRAQILGWIADQGMRNPCISWFDSDAAAPALAVHLRRFHVVDLSQDQKMMMRWYDTRILPAWADCLTPGQRALFFAGSCRWQCLGLWGKLIDIASPPAPAAIPAQVTVAYLKQPVGLDDRQFAALMEASEANVLLDRLRDVLPDETRTVPPDRLHAFIDVTSKHAESVGVSDMPRKFQLLVLATYTTGKAFYTPQFKEWIATAPKDADAFAQSLQALPDAVWQAGPSIWKLPQAQAMTPQDDADWVEWLRDKQADKQADQQADKPTDKGAPS